jgi:hypothetical protein
MGLKQNSLPWDLSKKTFDLKKAKKNQDGDYLLSYINCVWILNSKQKKSLLLLLL